MGVVRTKTIKNKHFVPKGDKGGKGGSQSDGASRAPRKPAGKPKGKVPSKEVRNSSLSAILNKKKKQKTYTAEELGIPKLNSITPVGVEKPKGKKKGKVFVDDPESMRTILALVQAEKEGQIESKMIKARQLEEIRQARKDEAEKKEQARKDKLEDVKDSIRKKRKRNPKGGEDDGDNSRELASAGTKAAKPKKKKKVAFA